MEETVSPVEEIESELKKCDYQIKLSDGLLEMTKTDAWKDIFEDLFLKAYRETSAYNVGILTPDGRDNYLHQITARSIFQRFVDGLLEDGEQAKDIRADLLDALGEEKKIAEVGQND